MNHHKTSKNHRPSGAKLQLTLTGGLIIAVASLLFYLRSDHQAQDAAPSAAIVSPAAPTDHGLVRYTGSAAKTLERVVRSAAEEVEAPQGIGPAEAPATASPAARAKTNGLVWAALGKLQHAADNAAGKDTDSTPVESPVTLSIPELYRFNDAGEIQLALEVADSGDDELSQLAEAGLRIELALAKYDRVQGWAVPETIEGLAELNFVERVSLPGYAQSSLSGTVSSEGYDLLGASTVHAQYDGSGVRVGVISNGVDHLAEAVAAGELPSKVTIHPSLGGALDEGTAMLEIVHDLAPGAELFFVGPGTDIEMVEAFRWLSEDAKCDVICDDLGFRWAPYFADGMVAQAAQQAIAAGSTCVSSGGNSAQEHYQGGFADSGQNVIGRPLHVFGDGAGSNLFLNFTIPPGQTGIAVLQWDAPQDSFNTDYEILITVGTTTYAGFAAPGAENDPVRVAAWTNTSAFNLPIGISVLGTHGASNEIEIFGFNTRSDDVNRTTADSIFGHAAAPGVISCGAISASDPGLNTIEAFSARGGSTVQFPYPEVRQTPTICGLDGVSVTGFGGFPSTFFGTSASSPHVAAIAALVLDKNPSLTPDGVRQALVDGASERGSIGYDPVFGFGLVDAVGAIDATGDSTPISLKQAWLAEQFGAGTVADQELEASVWGDQADPDQDGLPNLLEYAMGLDPNAQNYANSGAPQVRAAGRNIVMRFQRSKTALDASVAIQWSTDLKGWSDEGAESSSGVIFSEQIISEDTEIEIVEVTASAPAHKRLFLRVSAE